MSDQEKTFLDGLIGSKKASELMRSIIRSLSKGVLATSAYDAEIQAIDQEVVSLQARKALLVHQKATVVSAIGQARAAIDEAKRFRELIIKFMNVGGPVGSRFVDKKLHDLEPWLQKQAPRYGLPVGDARVILAEEFKRAGVWK